MFILGLISAAAVLVVVVFRCTDVFTMIFVVERFRHGPSLPLLLCFSFVCLCVVVVEILKCLLSSFRQPFFISLTAGCNCILARYGRK